MSDASMEATLAALTQRLDTVSDDLREMRGAYTKLADAYTKLAVLEERQTAGREAIERAFDEISQLKAQVKRLEDAQPAQAQASRWVHQAVGIVLAAVIGAAAAAYVQRPSTAPGVIIPAKP